MAPLPKCKKYKTVKGALKGVRNLVKNKEHWTQGTYARGSDGHPVDFSEIQSDEVTKVCVKGACMRLLCYENGMQGMQDKVVRNLDKVASANLGGGLIYVNDDLGHEAVLRMLDMAIAEAK